MGVLVGNSCRRLTGCAFGQLMLEALDVQLHLCAAPLGAHQIRHRDHRLAAILAVGGNAKVRRDLADDVAHNGSRQQGRIVRSGVVGVIQHHIDDDLWVVGGQHGGKGCHLLVVAISAAVHVQLFGSAGLAADAVAGHIGVLAAAGTGAHLIFHDLADHVTGTLADHLTADIGADLLNDVAVGIGDLIHDMGRDQIAAVDRCCHRSAHLQRGDRHGLTKGRGCQLHFAQLAALVVLHKTGLAGQVHARAVGEAKGVKVIVERLRPNPLAQLDVIDIAALAQGIGQIDGAVGLVACTVVGLLGHAVGTGTGKGGVDICQTGVHAHGRGDHLEHASGVIQLGNGLVLPLDIPEVAGIVRFLVQNAVAVCVLELVAVFILFVDAVQLRLGVHQLVEIIQIGTVIQRIVGVKVRLGGHCQNGTGLDIHHDSRAAVLHRVGRNGFVQIPLHDLLHVYIQRKHQIAAVLGGKGGGILVRNGIVVGVALGDGAAVHTGQCGLIGFFQSVGADAVCIRKAQHRRRKCTVGIIALKALLAAHRDISLAGCAIGTLVRLIELRNIRFNGQLDGVVHLGGQHLISGVGFGKCIVDLLVLGLVRLRRGIHRVQTLTVAGEQTQGQLPAHLGAHGGIQRAHLVVLLAGRGVQDLAVVRVGPDGPHHTGGSQRDAGGIIDLAAGRLDGGIQQLLLCRQLTIGLAVPDLDVIQAVGHTDGRKPHDRKGQTAAEQADLGVHAGTGTGIRPWPFYFFGDLSEKFWHGMLLRQKAVSAFRRTFIGFEVFLQRGIKPKKRALPHAFPYLIHLMVPRMFTAPL